MMMTAVETACKVGDEDDGAAIIVALRKLQTEIEELASQVLPLLTKEQQNVTQSPVKNVVFRRVEGERSRRARSAI
jgi:hypothetical protein